MTKKKKGQIRIYKPLHKKTKDPATQTAHKKKPGVNPGAPQWLAVPVPLVTPVALLVKMVITSRYLI